MNTEITNNTKINIKNIQLNFQGLKIKYNSKYPIKFSHSKDKTNFLCEKNNSSLIYNYNTKTPIIESKQLYQNDLIKLTNIEKTSNLASNINNSSYENNSKNKQLNLGHTNPVIDYQLYLNDNVDTNKIYYKDLNSFEKYIKQTDIWNNLSVSDKEKFVKNNCSNMIANKSKFKLTDSDVLTKQITSKFYKNNINNKCGNFSSNKYKDNKNVKENSSTNITSNYKTNNYDNEICNFSNKSKIIDNNLYITNKLKKRVNMINLKDSSSNENNNYIKFLLNENAILKNKIKDKLSKSSKIYNLNNKFSKEKIKKNSKYKNKNNSYYQNKIETTYNNSSYNISDKSDIKNLTNLTNPEKNIKNKVFIESKILYILL